MTYSTSKAADLANISASSVRLYTDKFGEFMSPGATPPKGKARLFNDDDVAVMAFVTKCKADGQTDGEIKARLDNGEWVALREEIETRSTADGKERSELAVRLAASMSQVQMLQQLLGRNDERIQQLTDQLINAEKRASVSEYQAKEIERLRNKIEALEDELKDEIRRKN